MSSLGEVGIQRVLSSDQVPGFIKDKKRYKWDTPTIKVELNFPNKTGQRVIATALYCFHSKV